MQKLIVFGSDGVLFNIKQEESMFDKLLEALGRGDEARSLQQRYLEKKFSGPLLLKEKIGLFEGISREHIINESRKLVDQYVFPEFKEVANILKEKQYLLAVIS